MLVEEMREKLKQAGYGDTVDAMKKGELKELVEALEAAGSVLDTVKPVAETQQSADPTPTDEGWTDYVLELFSKNELENGNPKVDGLRRVVEKLYGSFDSRSQIIDSPNINNGFRATVLVSLQFRNGDWTGWTVDGAADVFSGNTAAPYHKHAVATAETRAEGRALRKALKLVKVLSAEETYNADSDEPNGADNRIMQTMISGLNTMADRAGLDPLKTAIKMGLNIESLDQLTHKQGVSLATEIGKYHRGEVETPDEIKK